MNSAEAKKVLAAYLAGQRVDGEELQRAFAALAGDQMGLGAVAEALTSDSPPGDCEMFRGLLAEFSEMSRAEREREMPEMAAHLEACASCRRDYWEIAPLWREIEQAAHAASKQLAEGIRLALSRAGRLLDAGFGPPAKDFQPVIGTLGPEPEETPTTDSAAIRKEWTLRDEEAMCEIRLVLDGLPNGQAALSCSLEADQLSTVNVSSAQIEIREAQSGRRIAVGPLANFQRFTLEPGSCVIKLRVTGQKKSYAWEIPLAIEAPAN
ncbi:MAG: hypothetical protein AB7U82_13550 [Blastocatellales bacterium]